MKTFSKTKCRRIIPSRYPPINLFERVANPEDLEAVIEIEAMTNDRLRDEAGKLSLVRSEDRISGPGTSYIMAAFTHLNPHGSRFSDGSWGVFYASLSLETSIAETKYHQENFLRATSENTIHIDMRVITSRLTGSLKDITYDRYQSTDLYHSNNYSASQNFARELKSENSNGIHYNSVRFEGGKNVAVFKPRLLEPCLQEQHLEYVWDGERIASVFKKKLLS